METPPKPAPRTSLIAAAAAFNRSDHDLRENAPEVVQEPTFESCRWTYKPPSLFPLNRSKSMADIAGDPKTEKKDPLKSILKRRTLRFEEDTKPIPPYANQSNNRQTNDEQDVSSRRQSLSENGLLSPARNGDRDTVTTPFHRQLSNRGLTTTRDINRYAVGQSVTLVLKLMRVYADDVKCFANCETADGDRLVVLAFDDNTKYLAPVREHEGNHVKFSNVLVANIKNFKNKDVKYDFTFLADMASRFEVFCPENFASESPRQQQQYSPQNGSRQPPVPPPRPSFLKLASSAKSSRLSSGSSSITSDNNEDPIPFSSKPGAPVLIAGNAPYTHGNNATDSLTLYKNIDLLKLQDKTSLNLIVRNVFLPPKKGCFLNCWAAEECRVVVMGFSQQVEQLANLKAEMGNQENVQVRFLNVKAIQVRNFPNTDVKYDFLFLNDSVWEFVQNGPNQYPQHPNPLTSRVRSRRSSIESSRSLPNMVKHTVSAPSRPVYEHPKNDKLTTLNDIAQFRIDDIVSINVVLITFFSRGYSCFVNCLTDDGKKLVLVGFGAQVDILANLTGFDTHAVVKFVDVVALQVKDKTSSDVAFDFKFENSSKLLPVAAATYNPIQRLTVDPPNGIAASLRHDRETDYITTTRDTTSFQLDDIVTLVLILDSDSVKPVPLKFTCFVNCLTASNDKVVVVETGSRNCTVAQLAREPAPIVKFVGVKAVPSNRPENTIVNFDFKFLNSSQYEVIQILADFTELQNHVNESVKVVGQVNDFIAASNSLIVEGENGHKLIAKYSHGAYLLPKNGSRRSYLFEGFVQNTHGIELHVGRTPIPIAD